MLIDHYLFFKTPKVKFGAGRENLSIIFSDNVSQQYNVQYQAIEQIVLWNDTGDGTGDGASSSYFAVELVV